MEGFLSLEQAAEQLQSPVSELSRQIEEGRVVAIVKEGRSWLSAGEVSRLKRQSERASSSLSAEPQEELRLLHRSTVEQPRLKLEIAPLKVKEPLPVEPFLEQVVPPSDPVTLVESEAAPPVEPYVSSQASALFPEADADFQPEPEPVPELGVATLPAAVAETVAVPVSTPQAPPKPAPSPPAKPDPSTLPSPASEPSPPAPPTASPPALAEEKLAQQVRELNKRCAELESRNRELEGTEKRLKSGLQETEATLKRNRTARANLENDVLGLQEQLGKSRTRGEALEREVQHLGSELERLEDVHTSELRRMRSSKGERQAEERDSASPSSANLSTYELDQMRGQMSEKDRLLAQEYEQRAVLRSQLEDTQQKYYELKARYDKEKSEWSELLAQALQNQGHLRAQIDEMKSRSNPKGWNPFRREK